MINGHIEELRKVLADSSGLSETVTAFSQCLYESFASGKKLMTCGNGGSAAEAAHFAEEFTGRFWRERDSLPGMCLSQDGSLLTCIGNDYGFDDVFSRQVSGLGFNGDVLAVLTTSGNSENCYRALNVAKEKGLVTAAFLGKGGGRTKGIAHYEIIVPSDNTMRIQEVHLFLIHMICEQVERLYMKLDAP